VAEQGSHKPRVGGSSPPAATIPAQSWPRDVAPRFPKRLVMIRYCGKRESLLAPVQGALPLFPLLPEATLGPSLRDLVDEAEEERKRHSGDDEERQHHERTRFVCNAMFRS
jgi:hypothetical protein